MKKNMIFLLALVTLFFGQAFGMKKSDPKKELDLGVCFARDGEKTIEKLCQNFLVDGEERTIDAYWELVCSGNLNIKEEIDISEEILAKKYKKNKKSSVDLLDCNIKYIFGTIVLPNVRYIDPEFYLFSQKQAFSIKFVVNVLSNLKRLWMVIESVYESEELFKNFVVGNENFIKRKREGLISGLPDYGPELLKIQCYHTNNKGITEVTFCDCKFKSLFFEVLKYVYRPNDPYKVETFFCFEKHFLFDYLAILFAGGAKKPSNELLALKELIKEVGCDNEELTKKLSLVKKEIERFIVVEKVMYEQYNKSFCEKFREDLCGNGKSEKQE